VKMCEYCGCQMNMLDYEGENDPDFDPEKADRNKDGKISDWERSVGNAVAKSMREQKEKKSAEPFEAESERITVRDLEGNTYSLKRINEVQLNELMDFGDSRAVSKKMFFVDGSNGVAFPEGMRAWWYGGLDYDKPKTKVIDDEGNKYDMWERYLMEEENDGEDFEDTNVYMNYLIPFFRDENDEPYSREERQKRGFMFNSEDFESEFSKGDMLNLRKYIDYPLDWINENFIPKDTKKSRKLDQRMRGQIPTKRSPDDFRKGVRTKTPLWFKAIQGAIIAVAVGAVSLKGMSEAEEPEEPEREKEE